MKELTLEHVSPYFPYGLELFSVKDPHGIYDYNVWKPKPILRPLSDLIQPLYYKEFCILFMDDHEFNSQSMEMYILGRWTALPIEWPYNIVCWLCSKHFDVFGLIEAGLAIDINTISHA